MTDNIVRRQNPETDIEKKRIASALKNANDSFLYRRSGNAEIIDIYSSDKPKGTIVVVKAPTKDGHVFKAYVFRKNQSKHPEQIVTLESQHKRLAARFLLERLHQEEENTKTRAHSLKIDDVFCKVTGYTMRSVTFYKVTKIIDANHVEIVQIASLQHSGDWMSGTVVPNMGAERGERQKVRVYTHPDGKCVIGKPDGNVSLWNQKPEDIYCD